MHYKLRNYALALLFSSAYLLQHSSICHAAPISRSKSDGNSRKGSSISNSSSRAKGNTKAVVKTTRKITAEQAIALVKKRNDVKKFLALFPNGKSKTTQGFPVVEAEELDNNWNVHVYEQLPDHTATMNWFEVNAQTGAIKPMN